MTTVRKRGGRFGNEALETASRKRQGEILKGIETYVQSTTNIVLQAWTALRNQDTEVNLKKINFKDSLHPLESFILFWLYCSLIGAPSSIN